MTEVPHSAPGDDVRVTDLGLAAYLTLRGFPILRLDGRPGRRIFVFALAARAEADAYFHDPPVGALSFAESLRRVKARINAASLVSSS